MPLAFALQSCGLAEESASYGKPECSASAELVVDVSSSMAWRSELNELAQPPEPSRWDLTREGVIESLALLPNSWHVGLTLFPNISEDSPPDLCISTKQQVAVRDLDVPQRAALETALHAVKAPQGATPTRDALDFGVSVLRASAPVTQQFVVLLTDGAPTHGLSCTKDDDLVTELEASLESNVASYGIRTVVVGLPGSANARAVLSKLAIAGGSARAGCDATSDNCHIDLSESKDDLGGALATALAGVCSSSRGADD